MKLEKAESRDWKVAHLKSGYSLDVLHDDPLDNICQMVSDLIAVYNGDTNTWINGEIRKLTRANQSEMYDTLAVHLQDLHAFSKDVEMLDLTEERLDDGIRRNIRGKATGALINQIWERTKKHATKNH